MCYDSQAALGQLGKDEGIPPQKVILERMGHVLLWEAPDRLTKLICEFMFGVEEDQPAREAPLRSIPTSFRKFSNAKKRD